MNLGARMAAWSGGLSAKSYVQDGLIAMWDGIENAGWGTHSLSATSWVDLIGGLKASLTDVGSWDGNSLVCSGGERSDGKSGCAAYVQKIYDDDAIVNVEVVFKLTSKWGRFGTSGTQGPQFVLNICRKTANNSRSGCIGTIYPSTDSTSVFCVAPYGTNFGSSGTKAVVSGFKDLYFGKKISIHVDNVNLNGANSAVTYSTRINNVAQTMVANTTCISREPSTAYTGFGGARNATNGYYGMSGNIYCVRIYNRALADEEVKSNYKIDKARFGLA